MKKDNFLESNQRNLEVIFEEITQELGDEFIWQWDEKRQALLAEFSRDKKELCLPKIQQFFTDEWNKKTIKNAPKELKTQLGSLTKLVKEQLIFTSAARDEQPTIMAIWWPWGHGGTYSLRLVTLTGTYEIKQSSNKNWWRSIKEKFALKYL